MSVLRLSSRTMPLVNSSEQNSSRVVKNFGLGVLPINKSFVAELSHPPLPTILKVTSPFRLEWEKVGVGFPPRPGGLLSQKPKTRELMVPPLLSSAVVLL